MTAFEMPHGKVNTAIGKLLTALGDFGPGVITTINMDNGVVLKIANYMRAMSTHGRLQPIIDLQEKLGYTTRAVADKLSQRRAMARIQNPQLAGEQYMNWILYRGPAPSDLAEIADILRVSESTLRELLNPQP